MQPEKAGKLTRQRANTISVPDTWCACPPCPVISSSFATSLAAHLLAWCSLQCKGQKTTLLLLSRSKMIVNPKVPLALRLAAHLMRGVVTLCACLLPL